jgi:hypothetical protein
MIRGKDKVLSFIKSNDTPYWTVYPKGSRTVCLFKSDDQPNLSMTDSIDKLSENLDLLESGQYVISGKQELNQTKVFREIAFELINATVGSTQSQAPSNYGSNESIQAMIDSAVNRVRYEFETERLKEKINELEKQLKEKTEGSVETAVAGVIKRLDPYVDPICDRVFGKPKPTQIAAIGFNNSTNPTTTMSNTTATPQTQEEATKRVQDALALWQENDPSGNMILVIEKIAKIAATDKNKYNMYIPMLLSQ